ncbi:hypothetical protein D3C87_1929730 [compost metagenome]
MVTPVEVVSTPSIKTRVTYMNVYTNPYSMDCRISTTPVSPPPVLNHSIPEMNIAAAATRVRLSAYSSTVTYLEARIAVRLRARMSKNLTVP